MRRQRQGGICRYFRELEAGLSDREGFKVIEARWQRPDVVHATFYAGRPYHRRGRQKLVSSLFDMIPERHPEHFFLPGLRSPHANKASWLAASDLVISISAASADDLAFFQPRLTCPIRVIHLATAIDTVPVRPVASLLGRRFWLMVGKRHAYKNGLTLLRGLARLRDRPVPLLVCAGGGGWRPEERRWIRNNRLEDGLLQTTADDETLAWLYRHAEAVLVPSMAEGFSLPLIEALACNTPVIASDIEVHREVGGRFANLVPALNAEAWAEQLDAAATAPLSRPRETLSGQEYGSLRAWFGAGRLLREHETAYRSLLASD
ncbi:glycosyltransferase family 1 protein [Cyanobium sp. Copco_Reservoir_LC18]|jgi:glycosyltransferase involved in cell wall biosynthesis|uniref:glycosyltransferase family 4 protein n=1 Tax=Cyanobium sp. Copco_Reservoir_LC18 TaxID=1328305 RepID=UPI00135B7386|nr:glycosyltransferase family 1 protein [Cyanobium sp. Copco_Reservoir_LC18]